ncbi:DUF2510 domain-containing protein [Gordonia neofelifaecis]|uniref:DUF2510 domain-containing protein n=1 Tax=Gordonia neofelifaecis NRRL B-59395 TaxID=644548 RepID=F1YEZ6_9ACTN|nr:DUF2510 domain-containing protein [Gordonia neofelifaecis]EGD56980.1 hypothetical protein SCNU_01340 [Gordonia neofelifaecis NRRL B-59395]
MSDSPPPPNAPAGWYPDPEDPELLRRWDGAGWTDDARFVNDPPTDRFWAPPPSSADGPVGAGSGRRASATSRTTWIGAAAMVVIAALAAVVVIVGRSNSSSTSTADSPVTVSEPSETVDWAAASAAASSRAAHASKVADKSNYQSTTSRDWQLVAKNGDSHVGELYVVYGRVTQADSGTGSSTIRVDTDGEQVGQYEYDINTMVTEGTSGLFAETVKDDLVELWVEVTGSTTYETTMGGNVTALATTAYFVESTGTAG